MPVRLKADHESVALRNWLGTPEFSDFVRLVTQNPAAKTLFETLIADRDFVDPANWGVVFARYSFLGTKIQRAAAQALQMALLRMQTTFGWHSPISLGRGRSAIATALTLHTLGLRFVAAPRPCLLCVEFVSEDGSSLLLLEPDSAYAEFFGEDGQHEVDILEDDGTLSASVVTEVKCYPVMIENWKDRYFRQLLRMLWFKNYHGWVDSPQIASLLPTPLMEARLIEFLALPRSMSLTPASFRVVGWD